jgi:hypothetical protein
MSQPEKPGNPCEQAADPQQFTLIAAMRDLHFLLGGMMQQLDALNANLATLTTTVVAVRTKVDELKAGQVPTVDAAAIQAAADSAAAINLDLQGLLS